MGDRAEDYIRDCFKQGFTEDEVRDRLADAGYDPEDVEAAFEALLDGEKEEKEEKEGGPEPKAPRQERRRTTPPSKLPAFLFLILFGLITLAALYYYLFIMVTDCTGDPECFAARFANCRPARTSLVTRDGMSIEFIIQGWGGERCQVSITVTQYEGADEALWDEVRSMVGRSMTCGLVAMPTSLEGAVVPDNQCTGELVSALEASGRLNTTG